MILDQFKQINFSPTLYFECGELEYREYFNNGMREILENLNRLIDEVDDLEEVRGKGENKKPFINVNVDASSQNVNTNTQNNTMIYYSYEEVKSLVDDNTYLDDNSKRELLEKLDEIKEIEFSKESKSKKWDKAKNILRFIIDKGADIAIMYIPLIMQAIQK